MMETVKVAEHLQGVTLSLLIEDGSVRKKLADSLQEIGCNVIASNNFNDLKAKASHTPTQIIILDVGNAEYYREQREKNSESVLNFGPETLIISEEDQTEQAYNLAQQLQGYFLTQPVQFEELTLLLERILNNSILKTKLARYESPDSSEERFGKITVKSPEMKDLLRLSKVLAKRDDNILIVGSVGTGKELLAKTIHQWSERKDAPFFSINCNSFAGEDLVAELFGKGEPDDSYPKKEKTFIEMAEGGTILLKEISSISPNLQSKLLRLIEDKTYTRVNSRETCKANVRVIASTSKAIDEMVAKGEFSEDLYFRLNRFTLYLPDLRRRVEDIPILVREITQKLAEDKNTEPLRFTESALKMLMEYTWPGNIRELENVLDFSLLVAEDGPIDNGHLPKQFQDNVGSIFLGYDVDELPPMSEIERRYILRVMEATRGNKVKAADILEINRATLHRKLQIYDKKKIAKLA